MEANSELIGVLGVNRDGNGAAFSIVHGRVSRAVWARFLVMPAIAARRLYRPTAVSRNVPTMTVEALAQSHDVAFDTPIMDIE